MNATTYSNASEFLAKTQKILEQDEAANNLILGLSLRQSQFPAAAKNPGYFATITRGADLLLAAIMTPPRALVLYTRLADWDQPLDLLIHTLEARQWPIFGVTGYPPLAEAFAAAWSKLIQTTYQVQMYNRLYQLTQVKPIPPIPGRLRLATGHDLEWVARGAFAFQEEALGGGNMAEAREVAGHKINDQDIYLWDDGQPVSMAGQSRPTARGICIGMVYTPLEWRGRGYATACVAQLSQLLLDSGREFCVLFTDLANPTSNHIYQTIGYQPIGDFTEYVFDRESSP